MEKKNLIILAIFLVALIFIFGKNLGLFSVSQEGNSTTLTLKPTDDAYIIPNSNSSAGGADSYLKVGFSQGNAVGKITYIQWDLTSLPKNITIQKAQVCLYNGLPWNLPHPIYKSNTQFSESTINWYNQPCGINFDLCADTGLKLTSPVTSGKYNCTDITSIFNPNENNLILAFRYLVNQVSSSDSSYGAKEYGTGGIAPQLKIDYTQTQQTCNTPADTNCDNTVDRTELGAYITKWINNEVTRAELGEAIVAWVGG